MDLAIVCVATYLELEGTRLQGRAPRRGCCRAHPAAPERQVEALLTETSLAGATLDDDVVARAREVAASRGRAPISDLRGSADYRRHLVGVFVERAIRRLRELLAIAEAGGAR